METFFFFLIINLSVISCAGNNMDADLPVLSYQELGTITEGNDVTTVDLVFMLDKPNSERSGFMVSTEDNTAKAGEDYVAIKDQLIVFEKGDLSVTLTIEILGDYEYEESEDFYLTLSQPYSIELSQTSINISIEDNDEFFDPNLTIPETGYITPETYEGMNLLWQDEFEGAELNAENWVFDIGGHGWGNNEWEYYTDKNHKIVEGNLVIEAKKENYQQWNYTSSRIKSQGKFDFTYGRVDVRAALPFGQGIWPAIWMLGSSITEVGWPKCGEIDIMEMIGGQDREDTVHGTLHWANANQDHAYVGGQKTLNSGSYQDEFHVFSIIWDENSIQWFVDDQKYYEIDTSGEEFSEFDLPHFIIMNVAVGGDWPGYPDESTKFPQRLIVDYVRVFQNNQ